MISGWFLWTLVALVSWGVWAVVSKLLGEALTAAQSQALSTLGLLPVLVALAYSRKRSGLLPAHEPSRTEAGKLVTGHWSLVIGHLEGDTAKRRLRQSPITSDQLPVTSEPPLVQSPNARPELEVGATQEQCPGSTGISSDKSRSCPNSPAGCRRSQRGLACAFGAGLLACLGNVAYYHALNLGGKASTVAALTALYPLVTVGLAVLLLKERLGVAQLAGIGLSLLAIYLFNVPGEGGLFSGWLSYALVPIASWGVAGLLQKMSTNHLSGEASTLCFLAAFVPVAVVILLTSPRPEHIGGRTWLLVVALGLFFGLGNYAILVAFARDGQASVITPLSGLYPVVSVPLAILFLGEKVGTRELAGILLALVSVVALAQEKSNPANPAHPAIP